MLMEQNAALEHVLIEERRFKGRCFGALSPSLHPPRARWEQVHHHLTLGVLRWKPLRRLELYTDWTELNRQRDICLKEIKSVLHFRAGAGVREDTA